MGAWKPMLPWNATTVCGAVVDTALSAGLKAIVVAGYRADELIAEFAGRPEVVVVVNPDWELGMLGSVRTGFGRIGEPVAGFFVAPADMPRLPAAAFGLIAAELRDRAESRAIFAARSGRLGHPVWIPAAFMPDIASLDTGSRLRDYLLRRPWASVEVDDEGIFVDIDTPEAYAALRDATERGADPF
jgi:molybdenum cofactor cytidylyltransferase